jgi:aryl-alcohol dehydrogenase-like predicted oxidoreductase
LIGASKPSQVTDCIRSIDNYKFSEEELKKINEILKK